MPTIAALVSMLLLVAINVLLIYKRPKAKLEWILIIVYVSNLLFEITMFVFAKWRLNNHFLINIHSIFFGVGMFLILEVVWKRLIGKKISPIPLSVVLILYCLVWLLDNFILHNFLVFNPLNQAVIFLVNLCLVVYLLNFLLFIPKVGPLVNVDRFLIFAFLVHCFGCVVIDSFLNYYIELPESLYLLVAYLGQVLGTIAHFFVLLAVIWLVKTRKYISL